jgi:hypothetical protein
MVSDGMVAEGYRVVVTEKLPHIPPAYQPPTSVPADPYEPHPVPVHPYQPPRANRVTPGLIILVTVLAFVLCSGTALAATRFLTQDGPASSPQAGPPPTAEPATPEATAPEAAGALPALPALPASAEAELEDAQDGTSTSIHFTNESAETVTVMWLDYDHNRVHYYDLDPGQAYDQQTYGGHIWVVTHPDGSAIAVYEATATPSQVTIS